MLRQLYHISCKEHPAHSSEQQEHLHMIISFLTLQYSVPDTADRYSPFSEAVVFPSTVLSANYAAGLTGVGERGGGADSRSQIPNFFGQENWQ